jgi:MFS family permease
MILSLIGDNIYLLAVQFLAFQLTSSALTMGTVLLLAALPRAALLLVGGALSDRMAPRSVLLFAAAVRAAVLVAIGGLAITGCLATWYLYMMALIFGTMDALALPAGSRYLPSLVPRDDILRASAFMQATVGIFTLIGLPPIGGFVTILGAGPSLLAGGGCFVLVVVAVARIGNRGTTDSGETSTVIDSIMQGIVYLRGTASLRSMILIGLLLNVCLEGPIAVGLPYLASARYQSPAMFGAMLSTVAAGGILGAFGSNLFAARSLRLIIAYGLLLCGAGVAMVGMFSTLLPNCIALFIASAAAEAVNLQIIARLRQRVDPTFLGRVMSLVMFGSAGLNPLSIAVAGTLADRTPSLLFIVAGAGITLVGAAASRIRDLERLQ